MQVKLVGAHVSRAKFPAPNWHAPSEPAARGKFCTDVQMSRELVVEQKSRTGKSA